MSDHFDNARNYLDAFDGDTRNGRDDLRAATAHAAVDAAETLRRIEALLHDKAQGASAPHDGAGNPGEGSRERGGVTRGAPDAPATPQVGEVWEDTAGRRWQISEVTRHANVWVCRAGGWPPLHIDPANGWRRVSPAPAPLTEREVTAEAEVQGVEPASDEQIARWEAMVLPGEEETRRCRALIARVRAEQARAEKAEAQVALMRPVVEAAFKVALYEGDAYYMAIGELCRAVRTYREATRGA
ncbi:hypothetical protein [Microcystis phage Mae-JY09]